MYTWGENSTGNYIQLPSLSSSPTIPLLISPQVLIFSFLFSGQLGLDSQYIEAEYVKTPTLVTNKLIDLHPIKLVAFGKYHSVCVTGMWDQQRGEREWVRWAEDRNTFKIEKEREREREREGGREGETQRGKGK